MTEMPNFGDFQTGGIWAALAAAGLGGTFTVLKVWRAIRQEFGAAGNEKQQEAFQARTLSRATELEKELKELQNKYSDQSIALGACKGEMTAYKLQIESLTTNKDYSKERAQKLEADNHDLDKSVDMLTIHLTNAMMRLSILKGELDPKALTAAPLGDLPDSAKERLDKAMKSAEAMR